MPIRETVAGEANLSECVSKMKLTCAEISPRYRRDIAEMSPRCGRDTAEIAPRYGRDAAAHVGSELYPLARWHGEQPVVVQHGVKRFDPLGVDVAVAHDP